MNVSEGVPKFGFSLSYVPLGILKDRLKGLYQLLVVQLGQKLDKITQFLSDVFQPILAQIWGTFDKLIHSYTKFYILALINILESWFSPLVWNPSPG